MDVKAYLIELGYTEADAATLAADEKMSKAITASITKYEEGKAAQTAATETLQQTATQKAELEKWWRDTAQPAILNADGGTAAARAEAARYQAYIQSLKDQGYPIPDNMLTVPVQQPQQAQETQKTPTFDPRKAAFDMASSTAKLYDLGEEYRELYGARLPGAEALLIEAQQASRPLTDYVRSKFNFDGKRTEIAAKKESDRVASITKDITEKLEAKYAERSNPNLAPAVVSKAAAVVEANKDHKDDWKTRKGRNEAKKDRLLQFRNIS